MAEGSSSSSSSTTQLTSHVVCAVIVYTYRCRRLVLEWNAYIARTSSLRRVFVSVKGFYYQVRFMVMCWLCGGL
jgi:hypothetical protein